MVLGVSVVFCFVTQAVLLDVLNELAESDRSLVVKLDESQMKSFKRRVRRSIRPLLAQAAAEARPAALR